MDMEYQLLKRVYVKGLWGVKDINCIFADDVNILIGNNGSSKTTFLRLIEALINIDLPTIDDIEFDSVEFYIEAVTGSHSFIVIRMIEDVVSPVYRYILDTGEQVEIRSSDYRMIGMRRATNKNAVVYLHDLISGWLNISWLSITRSDSSEERRNSNYQTDVDRKLFYLIRKVISYRLKLETQVNERTRKFNEDIVSLLLFSGKYDRLPTLDEFVKLRERSKEGLMTDLHKVFSYFGDARQHSEDIKNHVDIIVDMIGKITSPQEGISAQEMLSLSLLNRTVEILRLSSEYQKNRADIMEPITIYLDIVGNFIKDKKFEFDPSSGNLNASLKYKDEYKSINIESLSSGEKQLLILLTETLLQEKKPYVFIADEPELSLHIEWQRNLIAAIRGLNPSAQIVFATHAPEIAAAYPKKLINMSKITEHAE